MRDVFTPVFLITLSTLIILNFLAVDYEISRSLVPFIIGSAVIFWLGKKYTVCYWLIGVGIGLAIGSSFLKHIDIHKQITQAEIPYHDYITIHGRLTAFPESYPQHAVLYLKSKKLVFQKKEKSLRAHFQIKVNGQVSHLFIGDSISIDVKISPLDPSANFFPSTWDNYRIYKPVHFFGQCKSPALVQITKKTGLFWGLIGHWRLKIRQILSNIYPNIKHLALLEALLLGERGQIDQNMNQSMLQAGIFHFLSISGAHIGIIAIFCLMVFDWLKIRRTYKYLITTAILLMFLFVSGMEIPAQRAVIMAIFIFTAKIFYLDLHIFNIISTTGLLMLIINPAQFLDPGFVLTFVLTAAIVWARKIIIPWLKKIPSFLQEFLSANISASILSLPLSLYFFKQYSWASLLAGIVLYPIVAVITSLGILLLLLVPFSVLLCKPILWILKIPLFIFFAVVSFFSRQIRLHFFHFSPSFWHILIIFILFYALGLSYKKKWLKWLLLIIFIGAMGLTFINISYYSPEYMEVYFLDVGQGDAAVAVFPGGDSLLIDGGGNIFSDFEVGKQVVLPFILEKRIKIKWVALTHFHPDHCLGIIEILNIIKPEELWLGARPLGHPLYKRIMAAKPQKTRLIEITSGYTRQVKDITVSLLHPRQIIESEVIQNNHSLVIKISTPFGRFLFCGDIESAVEKSLLQSKCQLLSAQVLKVAHHGSQSSSCQPFLQCVKPQLAVVSASGANRFDFPHRQVINRFRRLNCRLLTTGKRGAVKITSRPGGLSIETAK